MNKTELVAALAEKTQLPKKNAELALNDYHPGFQGACFQGWQVPQGRCQSVIVLNTIF